MLAMLWGSADNRYHCLPCNWHSLNARASLANEMIWPQNWTMPTDRHRVHDYA